MLSNQAEQRVTQMLKAFESSGLAAARPQNRDPRKKTKAPDNIRIAVAVTDIPANSAGEVRIWDGNQATAEPTGQTVLALYDWGAQLDIAANEQIFIVQFGDQWRILPPERDEEVEDNGSYVCCRCEMSKLYACVVNPDITVKKVTNPPSLVTGTTIEHQIELICTVGEEEISRIVQLDALDCTSIDCKTKDMTGEYVGDCEIGIIYYGNASTCATCRSTGVPCSNPAPHIYEQGSTVLSVVAGNGVPPAVRDSTITPVVRPASQDDELAVEIIFSVGTNGAKYFAIFNILPITNNFVFQIRVHKGITGIADGFYLAGSLGGAFIAGFDTASHAIRVSQDGGNAQLFFDGVLIDSAPFDLACGRSIAAEATLYNDYPGLNGIAYQAMDASTLTVTSIKTGFN